MPNFVVYVIVGSASAIIDLLTLGILLALNKPQWLAVTIAFVAGFGFNLKANARFTFVYPLTKKSSIRFMSVAAVNYFLTVVIIESLTAFSFSLITAKVVSLPITALSGYLLNKHWTFKF